MLKKIKEEVMSAFGITYTPVSYTHLDVYKRQAMDPLE